MEVAKAALDTRVQEAVQEVVRKLQEDQRVEDQRRTPSQQPDGLVSVWQSSNSIQILVVATRVEVHAGVRKVKARESKCEIRF